MFARAFALLLLKSSEEKLENNAGLARLFTTGTFSKGLKKAEDSSDLRGRWPSKVAHHG